MWRYEDTPELFLATFASASQIPTSSAETEFAYPVADDLASTFTGNCCVKCL
jgi:hypothetical protein